MPTELGRGSPNFPDGMSLNDLKKLYALPEDRRPKFQIVLGNGTPEDVTLDEYLKAELLPRHQMVLAYWLAGLHVLKARALPSIESLRHRKFYPGMLPIGNTIFRGAVQYIYDDERDFYFDRPVLEQVIAVVWLEIGAPDVGNADKGTLRSGLWKGRKTAQTQNGTMSEMMQFFLDESARDELKARKDRTLRDEIKSLESSLSGPVIHKCSGAGNANVKDVVGFTYDSRYVPHRERASERARPCGRRTTRFQRQIIEHYRELCRRFPDRHDLDRHLLELAPEYPNRNELRELNRRMYERRFRNTVV
jgi:hypothetical protein